MKNIYGFGDIVVIEGNLVGVVVKIWQQKKEYNYDIYVRSFNGIKNYKESQLKRFIYNKELSEEDLEFYKK